MSGKIPDGWVRQGDGSFSPPKASAARELPHRDEFEGRESDLHDQIEAELKRRRWYYVHSRTDKRTTQNNSTGVRRILLAAWLLRERKLTIIRVKKPTGLK